MAKATENHTDKGAIHGATHNVTEDGTTAAHECAGHNQQVVAQHETDRGGSPTRVAIEHGNHHRHVGTADSHNQVDTQHTGDDGHDDQCQQSGPVTVGTDKHDPQCHGNGQCHQIHQVTTRQGQCFAGYTAIQLAAGDQRSGKGYRTDENTEEYLDQLDGVLRTVGHDQWFDVTGEAHQHGSQTDKAVQQGYQLRHLGHFDPVGEKNTNNAAEHDRNQNGDHIARADIGYGDANGNQNPGDTIVVTAASGFLMTQTTEAENE